ncbi:unnamed protein product [Meganyctiphanes norvegica]|uniref:Uncharacterized protein n=1 Tax=Meganyctiphanes norvegica TaxID=48144 RepID=A0AAV2PZE1_MEGNR
MQTLYIWCCIFCQCRIYMTVNFLISAKLSYMLLSRISSNFFCPNQLHPQTCINFLMSKIQKATNICVNILSRKETKHLLHKLRSPIEGSAAPTKWLYSKEMDNILLPLNGFTMSHCSNL